MPTTQTSVQTVGTEWTNGTGQQQVDYTRIAGGVEGVCRTYPEIKVDGKVTHTTKPLGLAVEYVAPTSKELTKAGREMLMGKGYTEAQIDIILDFGFRNKGQSVAGSTWREQYTGAGIQKVTKALNDHRGTLITDAVASGEYEAVAAFNEALTACGEDKEALFALHTETFPEE
jgi:hypothetical protein